MNVRERITAPLMELRASAEELVRLNVELLAAELKAKGARYAGALALLVGAGVLALYALGFALTTIAVALSLILPLWLSLLIVTVLLALVVLVLVLAGRAQFRKAGAPVPEMAVAEAQATVQMVKSQVGQSAGAVGPLFARSPGPVRPEGQAQPHTPRWPVRPEGSSPAPAAPSRGASDSVEATPTSPTSNGLQGQP